ncbi:MAG: SIR2 family protein [Alphaproteobacteria bacterium]|nr:SIR2 family protein [Alphaproteobacteria bacterium]
MTSGPQPHDAHKTLSDLRDHLARHDKPIAFLFGAGTSCSVLIPSGAHGKQQPLIPAVLGLTASCKKDVGALGEKFKAAWAAIETRCKDNTQDPNVENVLSRLRMMLSAVGKSDTLAGLNPAELMNMEECVRKTIARLVTPDLKQLPADFPHSKFARWLAKTSRKRPVEIYTVNYDVLIEHALELERIPVFDGFVGCYQPFFHADSVRRPETMPGANWARLWKMHGSVTWRRVEQNGHVRVIRGEPDAAGEMILPSFQKYDESRQQPYVTFTDGLTRFLEQDDALLIVAGFAFADEHINNLIFGALENRPRTHVYALQFEELPEDNILIRRSFQRSNMIVIGPDTGVIGGRRAKWAPADTPSFMHGVFQLKNGGAAENLGVMKVGDFACFCSFLESMTPG